MGDSSIHDNWAFFPITYFLIPNNSLPIPIKLTQFTLFVAMYKTTRYSNIRLLLLLDLVE